MTDVRDRTESIESSIAPAWARERAEMLQGLYIHLLVYVLINSGLAAMNWVTKGDDGSWWVVWPIMAWGVGLVIHMMTVVLPVFSAGWVDRRAQRLADRAVQRSGDDH